MKKDPAYVRMDLLQNPYIIHMGRVTRFERANARFTAESVRPLHHTRHFRCLNILTISYDFVK